MTLEFTLVRSARLRKSVRFHIERGRLILSAPLFVTQREAADLVREHEQVLRARLAAAERSPMPAPLDDGARLPIDGVERVLSVRVHVGKSPVPVLSGERFTVTIHPADAIHGREAAVRGAVLHGLSVLAHERVMALVAEWSPRLGVTPGGIRVKDQRQRWGSCGAHDVLRFNLRLAMLPPALQEYVVVHELAHLRERNHSPQFWNVMAEALPAARTLQRQLRALGSGVSI